ncbi:MAG: hypothetical protein R3C28_13045 [Pirellulaceae bacterium]
MDARIIDPRQDEELRQIRSKTATLAKRLSDSEIEYDRLSSPPDPKEPTAEPKPVVDLLDNPQAVVTQPKPRGEQLADLNELRGQLRKRSTLAGVGRFRGNKQ